MRSKPQTSKHLSVASSSTAYEDRQARKDIEVLKLRQKIWAKAVDTQIHFNEMSYKSRRITLSIVGAALGVSSVLLNTSFEFNLWFWSLNEAEASALLIWAAAVFVGVGGYTDIWIYQLLLVGAVKFGWDLERTKRECPAPKVLPPPSSSWPILAGFRSRAREI